MSDFFSPYQHGFVRAAVCIPPVKPADPVYNCQQSVRLAGAACARGAAVILFPELGLSGYSNDDLFHQDALLATVEDALAEMLAASEKLNAVILLGAPVRNDARLFICAIAVYKGRILGVVPKSYLPNYREFYEKRQFCSAAQAVSDSVRLCGQQAPFGSDLLFCANNIRDLVLHVEICEDLWVPIPPSSYAAMAGATILANLSASNITIGKAEYRRQLCMAQSAKCIAAYLYSAAGPGESTTDVAWDGQALICENGEILREGSRFPANGELIVSDIDLERLVQDRMRMSSFADCAAQHAGTLQTLRRVGFELTLPGQVRDLARPVDRFPYVPNDSARRDERCYEAYNIQVHGLMKRLQSSAISKVVIGVSGGLDSTHALIVAAKTMDKLDLPRSHILAYTMPGFATSDATLHNAHALMKALQVSAHEIDIRPSCMQMFRDLGHPFALSEPVYDITFENVQAGERTSHLFRLANYNNALVLGTGDLSELALGWCTYGVGDHMSHYNVNASVPKTLIQYLIRWVVDSGQFSGTEASAPIDNTLRAILATEISPELVPMTDRAGGQQVQSTEQKIGPYELQDFNLYYISRFGFRPSKIAFLAYHAWHDESRGDWPDSLPAALRNAYDLGTIKHWLDVFLYRFFQLSQFKRSCVPNGPKVGSGGSLSPRGDWRAPSDAGAQVWLDELRSAVPQQAGDIDR